VGKNKHIIHYGTGIFIKAKKYILLKRNKIKSQYDFYSRVGFFVNEHCNIKTNHTDDET
jgi:hypothetical protein